MSKKLIELVLKERQCNQKELAKTLGVSQAQISKWKNGEYMSESMKDDLRELAGIGDLDAVAIEVAGDASCAREWQQWMSELAEFAVAGSETGYDSELEGFEENSVAGKTFDLLQELGVLLPDPFKLKKRAEVEGYADICDLIDQSEHVRFIYNIYKAFDTLSGFYIAYIEELHGDDEERCDCTVDLFLLDLAAGRTAENQEVDIGIAPNFYHRISMIGRMVSEALYDLKKKAVSKGIPVRAEPFALLYEPLEQLSEQAQANALGFKAEMVHPDIYINELVVGMRTLHQAIPAILEKLQVEFKLDTSELLIGPKE